MSACLPVNCSVPSDYITEFDADPDIDGIGVCAYKIFRQTPYCVFVI